jgi:hypothetical protein
VDDGIKQRSIAAELELSADDAGAMSKEAWNNCVEFNTWPAGWERLTVALPPGIANLINQMACELLEREQGVGDRGAAENANVPQCHAPEVQLADIVPDHSRHPEDILKEPGFVENVRQRGVKSPISLRPHPTLPGKWLINDGYRRFWAAQAVGLRTIPYVVDVNFDSDDQLNDYVTLVLGCNLDCNLVNATAVDSNLNMSWRLSSGRCRLWPTLSRIRGDRAMLRKEYSARQAVAPRLAEKVAPAQTGVCRTTVDAVRPRASPRL